MRRWTRPALIACVMLTSACAGSLPSSTVAPPRLELPPEARAACALPRLAAEATEADLDRAYAARGAALVACDAARRLAVETLETERRMVDAWLAADP